MRSFKNSIFIGIGVLIILAQIVYVLSIRKDIITQILDIQSQSALKYAELAAQEKHLKDLPNLQKEIAQINARKNAAKKSMPTTTSAAKEFIEFIRLMESNQFIDMKVEKLEESAYQNEAGHFLEKKYKLTYTSTYQETRAFIQNLNQSYQLINIASFKIDNSPQRDQDNKMLLMRYGSDRKKVVASTVEFSMFMLVGEPIEDEVYTTNFKGLNNIEEAFLNTDVTYDELIQEDTQQEEQTPMQSSSPKPLTDSTFRLELWDVLASGDNYSFVGPGPIDTVYTGLKSSKSTFITLNLREDGYDISLEDEQGKVKQNGVLIPIKNPSLNISSDIAKIQETMPEIHIYINNTTKDIINVRLKGSLLETIHIYNEFEEKVLPGQTKGKVKLT